MVFCARSKYRLQQQQQYVLPTPLHTHVQRSKNRGMLQRRAAREFDIPRKTGRRETRSSDHVKQTKKPADVTNSVAGARPGHVKGVALLEKGRGRTTTRIARVQQISGKTPRRVHTLGVWTRGTGLRSIAQVGS